MKQLTEEQQLEINLRWAAGRSVKETAGELHHSLSTVSKYYAILNATPVADMPLENRRHRFSNRREVREQVKEEAG